MSHQKQRSDDPAVTGFRVTSHKQHRRSFRLRASCVCGAWIDITSPTEEGTLDVLARANAFHQEHAHA